MQPKASNPYGTIFAHLPLLQTISEMNRKRGASDSSSALNNIYVKAACSLVSGTCICLGIRNVLKPIKDTEFPVDDPTTAIRLGRKALANSMFISISSFVLLITTLSIVLDVNTPKQFGQKMKRLFGDRMRISKPRDGENYESFSDLLDAYTKKDK